MNRGICFQKVLQENFSLKDFLPRPQLNKKQTAKWPLRIFVPRLQAHLTRWPSSCPRRTRWSSACGACRSQPRPKMCWPSWARRARSQTAARACSSSSTPMGGPPATLLCFSLARSTPRTHSRSTSRSWESATSSCSGVRLPKCNRYIWKPVGGEHKYPTLSIIFLIEIGKKMHL